MTKFAKLFEIDQDNQVLLTLDYNDEKKLYEVNIRIDVNGVSFVAGLGFEEKVKALEALKKYNKSDAEQYRKSVLNILSEK